MRVSTSPIHNSACTDIKESAVGVCAEIAKLQRVLGKTTLENEILKEAVRYAAEKSGLRSPVRDLPGRGEGWADGRSHRTPSDDAGLLAELRQEIADLPSWPVVFALGFRTSGAGPASGRSAMRPPAGCRRLRPS